MQIYLGIFTPLRVKLKGWSNTNDGHPTNTRHVVTSLIR